MPFFRTRSLSQRLEAGLAAAADLDAEVEACERERTELAKREAAGGETATSLADLAAIDNRAAEASSAAAHRRRVAAALEQELQAESRRGERRRFERAADDYMKADEAVRTRTRRVSELAKRLAGEAKALETDRAAASAAVGRLRDLQPADAELPEGALGTPVPVVVDVDLIRFLDEERRRADGAARARAAAENAEAQERQMVREAVEFDRTTPRRLGKLGAEIPSAVARLPEHLRDEARAELERRVAERSRVRATVG